MANPRFSKPAIIRSLAFITFLTAMAGPWMFDRVNVPAQYACEYRLEGDFCGIPISGFQAMSLFGLGFINMVVQAFMTNNAYHHRIAEFLVSFLFLFPVFPFIGNLLLIFRLGSQKLQIILWILACVLLLPVFFFQRGVQAGALWGGWLYIMLAIGMSAAEFLLLRKRSTAG
jgi:hypothetical protein